MKTVSLFSPLNGDATDSSEILLAVTQNNTTRNRNMATSHFATDNQTEGLGSTTFSWWILAVCFTVKLSTLNPSFAAILTETIAIVRAYPLVY